MSDRSPHPPPPKSLASLVAAFTTFLTVAVHSILYLRGVYPARTFLRTRAYNYPVHQSRHPGVCTWIRDAVTAIEAELLKGGVDRVALVIAHPQSFKPLERFVWDVSRWARVPPNEADAEIVRVDDNNEKSGAISTKEITSLDVSLDEQLRAILAKLSVCDTRLKPVPEGCTFTLAIELRDETDPPIGHPQPWIPAEPNQQRTARTERNKSQAAHAADEHEGSELGGAKTVPLRSVDAGEMLFEMWIEEGRAKYDESQDLSSNEATSFATSSNSKAAESKT